MQHLAERTFLSSAVNILTHNAECARIGRSLHSFSKGVGPLLDEVPPFWPRLGVSAPQPLQVCDQLLGPGGLLLDDGPQHLRRASDQRDEVPQPARTKLYKERKVSSSQAHLVKLKLDPFLVLAFLHKELSEQAAVRKLKAAPLPGAGVGPQSFEVEKVVSTKMPKI